MSAGVNNAKKKTIQPKPLKTFVVDEVIFEIRDHETREIGRGLDKQWKAINLTDGILDQLVNMVQGSDSRKAQEAIDLLESPKSIPRFIRLLQEWGYEESDRTLRKYAERCRKQWSVLSNACRKAGIDPYRKR